MQLTDTRFTQHIAALARAAVLMLCVLVCAACSSSDDDGGLNGSSDPDATVFTMRIVTYNTTSRSWSDPYDRKGNAAENRINVTDGDFRVYLFDKDGKFLQIVQGYMETNGSQSDYVLRGKIARQYTDFGSTGSARLTVLALANWREWGAIYPTPARGTLLNDFIANTKNEFKIASTAWYPFGSATPKRGIPMFGYHIFTLTKAEAEASTEYAPATLRGTDDKNDLYMMRSMAKIEIVDAMEKAGSDAYPALDKIIIDKYIPNGLLVPKTTAWKGNGLQASAISMPEPYSFSGSELNMFKSADYDSEGVTVNGQQFTGRDMMVAYVPEQYFANAQNSPNMTITVRDFAEGTKNPTKTVKYRLNLHDIIGQTMLRNHVYRIRVAIAATEIVCSCTIRDWEQGDGYVQDMK